EDEVAVVHLELGPLVAMARVVDGERVQGELLLQELEVAVIRVRDVEPHARALLHDEVGGARRIERLLLEHALAIETTCDHGLAETNSRASPLHAQQSVRFPRWTIPGRSSSSSRPSTTSSNATTTRGGAAS